MTEKVLKRQIEAKIELKEAHFLIIMVDDDRW